MRELLTQHLVSHTIAKDDIVKVMTADEDLLFKWDILSAQLTHETSLSLLKEIIDLWTTIRGHAYAKHLTEQYKQETGKGKNKRKSFREELKKGEGSNS